MDENQLKLLAEQLSCPSGETGAEIARRMEDNNRGMILATLEHLNLHPGDHTMEIGHGNGWHLPRLFEQFPGVRYFGLERSELMHQTAKQVAATHGADAVFSFSEADIFPYGATSFQTVFSVNTLYFWKDPAEMLGEIARVLVKGGRCVLGYTDRQSLEQLPFTKYGFRAYDDSELAAIAETKGLKDATFHQFSEQIATLEGDTFERHGTIGVFLKS